MGIVHLQKDTPLLATYTGASYSLSLAPGKLSHETIASLLM